MKIHKKDISALLWLLAACVLLGAAIGALLVAPEAKAQTPVCNYLDTHPGVAGVEDVMTVGIFGGELTPYEVGQSVAGIVINQCPRHLWALNAFIAKWGSTGSYVA